MGISHYHTSFSTRSYEVGRWGFISAGTLLRYLEHIATEASAAAGYPRRWYDEHETAWVVRRMSFEQMRPITSEESLGFETWPSQFARIQAFREYLVSVLGSGEMVARAHAHWVYVGRQRGLPTRLPADFPEHAIPDPQEVHLGPAPTLQPLAFELPHARMRLQARRSEADIMGHINNSVYMDWLEEAVYEAVEALVGEGVILRGDEQTSQRCFLQQATLDYMKACLPGEEIEVETRLTGSYAGGLAWQQTISRPSAERILQAVSWWSWLA